MSKIIRTPTMAKGGITAKERAQMEAHARLWIERAMRTDPIEPDKIIPAITGLYKAAGLKEPRVVIAPSPLVMAFAYGAAAAIWHRRKSAATYAATDTATSAATYAATSAATSAATYAATDAATDAATRAATSAATIAATDAATIAATDAATCAATRAATSAATIAATDAATYAATDAATDAAKEAENGAKLACYALAGELGLRCASRWSNVYQGGSMWSSWDAYLTAARDILGLQFNCHEKYAFWEQAAIHGGFRVMHEEFCIVSDFQVYIKIDAENRPHCETGPSHLWRDGWALYHWHGVSIPAEWIEDKASLTAQVALTWPNVEQRRAACEILGWNNILAALDARVIDADGDPEIGELVEVTIPEIGRERFLRVRCGTGREFALPVPPNMQTALEAQAWTWGLDAASFSKPEVRT